MARNATNLLNRKNGYKSYIDNSGNVINPAVAGGYVTIGPIRFYSLTTAITKNVTTTTAPAGSIAHTTNATGLGHFFYSDGTKWQSHT